MSSRIISNILEKCVGCNRCIRECPIEEANVVSVMDSRIIVKIDNDKCIACGACISVCTHESRGYIDDTQSFFNDLKNGVNISLITAPSFKTNFRDWRRILTWLKKSGVDKVFDVSLGADICTWSHIRYLQKNIGKKLITQPCPAVVNYITKHKPNLIEHLSPVHSPMLCMAVYMRKYEGVNAKIAAISPCIAKTHEFEDTEAVEYNVTFKNLAKYIKENSINLPDVECCFDNCSNGLGALFPTPGGLKENVEHYLGKELRIDKSEGQHMVYKTLDEYAEQPYENLPVLFDVLNCPEGCNCGTAHMKDNVSTFEMQTVLDSERRRVVTAEGGKHLDELYKKFDESLKLEDFLRKYNSGYIQSKKITDDDIEKAFSLLDKNDFVTRNFNCGACGCNSCYEMARKIAKGVNIPHNCMEKAHRDTMREHEQSVKLAHNVAELERVAELNKVQERLGAIVAIADAGIVIKDKNHVIQTWNEGAHNMLGYTSEEAIGQTAKFYIPKSSYAEIDEIERCLTEGESILRRDTLRVHKNGSLVICSSSYTPLYDENKEYSGSVVIFQDITDIRRMEQEIKEKHQMIMSSIDYASKIQRNLLPDEAAFRNAFSDFSIIWGPRDLVGGDIYWVKSFDEGSVLCVCDCTGHGTPGALLTMLVVSIFESVINEDTYKDTAKIIWKLEQRLVSALHVNQEQSRSAVSDINDGCDLAVLYIADNGSITVSAGHTSVFVCGGGEVKQIKGQKIFVGEGKLKGKEDINTIVIPPNPDNCYYVASDGLFDQIGGEFKRPFGYKTFNRIISGSQGESLTAISQKIWDAFEEYRGDNIRRDDVELIAFRPKVKQI